MAMTILVASPPVQAGLSARWSAGIRRFIKRVRRSFEVARRRRVLQQMPDYLLKDIGIPRCEIDSLIIDAVDGRPDRTRHPRRWY
jgi:uncharacterized protein YjiS (DUF1127 family)